MCCKAMLWRKSSELPVWISNYLFSMLSHWKLFTISIAAEEAPAYLFVTVFQYMKDHLTVIKRIHSEINSFVVVVIVVFVLLCCFCIVVLFLYEYLTYYDWTPWKSFFSLHLSHWKWITVRQAYEHMWMPVCLSVSTTEEMVAASKGEERGRT